MANADSYYFSTLESDLIFNVMTWATQADQHIISVKKVEQYTERELARQLLADTLGCSHSAISKEYKRRL